MSLELCKALFVAVGLTGGFWIPDPYPYDDARRLPRFRSKTYKQAKRRQRRLGFRR